MGTTTPGTSGFGRRNNKRGRTARPFPAALVPPLAAVRILLSPDTPTPFSPLVLSRSIQRRQRSLPTLLFSFVAIVACCLLGTLPAMAGSDALAAGRQQQHVGYAGAQPAHLEEWQKRNKRVWKIRGGEKEEEDASNANHAAGLGHGSIPTIEYVSIEELSKASAGAAAAFATSLDLGGNGEWKKREKWGGGQNIKPQSQPNIRINHVVFVDRDAAVTVRCMGKQQCGGKRTAKPARPWN